MKAFLQELTGLCTFSLVVLAFASGCSSTPKTAENKGNPTCRNIDWYETGRSDGEVGASKTKIDGYRKQCGDSANPIRPDLYLNGREAGLVDYCTAAGGFDAGKTGNPYSKVCPEPTEEAFLENYEIGHKIFVLESENAELDSRIHDLNNLLLPTLRGGSVHAQIEQLQSRRANNDSAISNLEDRAGI